MLGAWWRRGCPAAIGFLPWALVSPLWLLTALASTTPGQHPDAAIRLLFALCAHLFVAVPLGLLGVKINGRATVQRSRLSLIVFALIGPVELAGARSLGLLAGEGAFDLSIAKLVTSSIAGVAWGFGVGALVDALQRDRRTRGQLLRSLAWERTLVLQAAGVVDDYRKRVINETQAVVAEQLHKAMVYAADPPIAANRLHELVDEVVRPLSHELRRTEPDERALVEAVEEVSAPGRTPFREYLRLSINPTPRMLPMACALVLASLLMFLTDGLNGSAMRAVSSVALVALAISYALATDALESVVRRDERSLTTAIDESEWATARLRQLAWSERERIGRAIHGDVQARIVATALQVQLGDPANVPQALQTLEAQLQERFTSQWAEDSWQRALQRVVDVWQHSVTLSVEFPDAVRSALDADAVAGHAVVEVVREAITNSVRHGNADVVRVAARRLGDVIELTVTDNGAQTKQAGAGGMGSRMMTAACLRWSLQSQADGHTLTARITTGGTDE